VQQCDKYYVALSVAIQLGFVCIVFQYLQFSQTPFFCYAVGGAFVILVATASSRMEWLLSCLFAPLFAFAYSSFGGHFGDSIWSIPANVTGFLGLSSSFVLGWKAVRKSDSLPPFLAAMSIPLFTVITAFALASLMRIEPLVYDFYLSI